MAHAASFLLRFRQENTGYFHSLAEWLPDRSFVFSLNYDSIFEDACERKGINLLEPGFVNKTHFHSPRKEFQYFQIHGGASLVVAWQNPLDVPDGAVVHTDRLCRLKRFACVIPPTSDTEGVFCTVPDREISKTAFGYSVLFYYDQNKTHMVSPVYMDRAKQERARQLNNDDIEIIIIGCRFSEQDKHLWDSIRRFKGNIYWCGSETEMEKVRHITSASITFKGRYFEDLHF